MINFANFLLPIFLAKAVKKQRQKSQLIRPEFGFLFDEKPAQEWVSLDLEMTGLNPKTDHILSFGAVKIYQQNNSFHIDTGNALSLICCPPVMPNHDSIVIHGLRPQDVANGISYDEMLPKLFEFVGSLPIIGFCVSMDMGFINQLAKPFLGTNLPNQTIDISQLHQQILHKKDPNLVASPKHLTQLLTDFDIPKLPTHDALNDAIMTAMLFCHLQK